MSDEEQKITPMELAKALFALHGQAGELQDDLEQVHGVIDEMKAATEKAIVAFRQLQDALDDVNPPVGPEGMQKSMSVVTRALFAMPEVWAAWEEYVDSDEANY